MKRITYLALGALFMVVFFAAFSGCMIKVDDPQPTLVITLEPQTTFTRGSFGFRVYADGSGPSTAEEGIAAGGAPIQEDGTFQWVPIALIWDTNIIWRPAVGGEYDVYPYLDLNGTGEYEEWYDIDYAGHLNVTITGTGENEVSVSEADFAVTPQPSPASVYSETYPPTIEPSWWPEGTTTVDLDNEDKTAYDGDYALKIVYAINSGWVHAQYVNDPPIMDVSASKKIVLYIENTSANFDFITVYIGDGPDPGKSVDIGPGLGGGYRTDTNVGPGNNWDEYTIPFTDVKLLGLDWTQLCTVNLGVPNKDGELQYDQPLYFDHIHFAP